MIDYFPLVQRIVATSDAISFTTEEYAGSAAFASAFARVPGDALFPRALLCCAFRSRWEPPVTVRAFVRAMRETAPERHDPKA